MIRHDLHCIDLDQPGLEGFRRFISAWLYRCDGRTVVVDPGPLSTIPHLIAALESHGVERIDFVLLTHIHIDHAGGTGALLKRYPEAEVICHSEGIRHLIDPEKLWRGSQQVLGRLAEVYGEIVPVPAEQISFREAIAPGLTAIATPGHAVHHLSFLAGSLLFAGEVAGVRNEAKSGVCLRPATPPRFLLDVALASLDKVIAAAPQQIVFAHYGLADDAATHLAIARRQLLHWVGVVADCNLLDPKEREAAIAAQLRATDPWYSRVAELPIDIQKREAYFLGNSLRGMIEYVESLDTADRAALRAGVLA